MTVEPFASSATAAAVRRTPVPEEGAGMLSREIEAETDGLSFVDQLPHADREALLDLGQPGYYAQGTTIVREGEPADALYIVRSGRIAIVKEDQAGCPALLAYRGPGAIIGEIGVMADRPRIASVVAAEDCELVRVEPADFRHLVAGHPAISRAIVAVLSERLMASSAVRATLLHEKQDLSQRVSRLHTEAERLAEVAQLRQDTVNLIVHDLRSPIGVVDGCLQLLRASLPEEALASTSDVLDLAERGAQRLSQLAESLLEAARQESSTLAAERQPVDVPALLQQAIAAARAAAAGSNLALTLDLAPGLPALSASQAQLERVVSNLVDNALSYTPAGGQVCLAARMAGEALEISVTDTGPGVPPEHRERIFERFGRVPGKEGRRRGFGLGLYFCRSVAHAHGGRIWVESGPDGVGSRFILSLPLGAGPGQGEGGPA